MALRIYSDPGHAHFLTFSCFHRRQYLTNLRIQNSLAQCIDRARRNHDFSLWAYVFMPEHVHLLIHPNRPLYSISNILRDIKLPVARSWIAYLHRTAPHRLEAMKARQGNRVVHRLWQAGGGYDRNLFTWDTIAKAIDYIEWNPVTRGLAIDPCGWTWSSARARAGAGDVPLGIDALDDAFRRDYEVLSKP
jgi:putative transposase